MPFECALGCTGVVSNISMLKCRNQGLEAFEPVNTNVVHCNFASHVELAWPGSLSLVATNAVWKDKVNKSHLCAN